MFYFLLNEIIILTHKEQSSLKKQSNKYRLIVFMMLALCLATSYLNVGAINLKGDVTSPATRSTTELPGVTVISLCKDDEIVSAGTKELEFFRGWFLFWSWIQWPCAKRLFVKRFGYNLIQSALNIQ